MNGNQARGMINRREVDYVFVVVYACEADTRTRSIQISKAAARALLLSFGPEEVNVTVDGNSMTIGKHPGDGRK